MLFILLPSLSPTGPVKGAVALANALSKKTQITIVALKAGPGVDTYICENIQIKVLEDIGGFKNKLRAIRGMLKNAGGRDQTAVVSYCFSADMINMFCKDIAVICSSVRGNLPCNYRMDYGWKGSILAILHLFLLRRFDYVVAMTHAMAHQISRYSFQYPKVIGNFVDEQPLEMYRSPEVPTGHFRIVFLASLSARKMPLLLLSAIKKMRDNGIQVELDILGDGPISTAVKNEVKILNIEKFVNLHGHVANPYPIVAKSDVMVLPSLSEGLPRAALEALHLGVPCILRSVDGNAELIHEGENGALFETNEDLPDVILKVALWSRARPTRLASLLPEQFRQIAAADKYFELLRTQDDIA